jgi:hypothetical protein
MNMDKVVHLLSTDPVFEAKAKVDLKQAASAVGYELSTVEVEVISEYLDQKRFLQVNSEPEELPSWRVSSWNTETSSGSI